MCKRGNSVVGQMQCEPPWSSVRRTFNAFLCAEEFGHVESLEIWTLPVWGVLEGFWPVPFNFRCMIGPCPGHLNLQADVICCQISRQIGGLLLMQWNLGISPMPSSPQQFVQLSHTHPHTSTELCPVLELWGGYYSLRSSLHLNCFLSLVRGVFFSYHMVTCFS